MALISTELPQQSEALPISIFIVTKNEAKNISRLLLSLKQFDEIIVVDSGSTDNTIEIANEHGAKVIHQDWLGYSKQKQYAMEQCKNSWVMNLDADEVVSEELICAIRKCIQEPNVNAVRFLRIDYFMDKPMPRSLSLPKNVRLYRKECAHFDKHCLVHESASIKGSTKFIKIPFTHYGYNDLKIFVDKLNHYSSLKALEKFNLGKKASFLKILLILPFEFTRKLILQRYVLFGWRGFLLSALNANYSFMKEVKLLQLHLNNKSST